MNALGERLQSYVTGVVERSGAPTGMIAAVSPRPGQVARAAAGTARADGLTELTASTPFHIASVGKVITATLVVRAAEEGRLGPAGLDASLHALAELGLVPPRLAEGFHPRAAQVTVRHLLRHTSGAKDMQVDDASGTAAEHGGLAPGSIQAMFWRAARDLHRGRGDGADARRHWVPWDPDRPDDPIAGHLNRFLATGTAASPVGGPGERFHYSDTAYVLLGLVVEAAYGVPYHVAQRRHVLDPLGMADTYLAGHDDPRPDARAHEMDVWLADVPLLSSGLDLSFDWGGGGQVSTVDDLLRLVRGVADGTCLHDPTSAAEMLRPVAPPGLEPPRVGVGLGVQHLLVGERTVVGHSGAWGVRMFLDPATGIAVAATVGRRDDGAWLTDLFDLAAEHLDDQEVTIA